MKGLTTAERLQLGKELQAEQKQETGGDIQAELKNIPQLKAFLERYPYIYTKKYPMTGAETVVFSNLKPKGALGNWFGKAEGVLAAFVAPIPVGGLLAGFGFMGYGLLEWWGNPPPMPIKFNPEFWQPVFDFIIWFLIAIGPGYGG